MIRYFIILLLSINYGFALKLDNLLQSVKDETNKELAVERQRVNEFARNTQKQSAILISTKKELLELETLSENVQKQIDENEVLINDKQKELDSKAVNLGEMFGSVRQTSTDFLTNYKTSYRASEDLEKIEELNKFANSKKLPNTEELENFWHLMLDEIIQSGKISQYESDVILTSGEKVKKEVTRVGLFAAVSDGNYLTYSEEMKSLVELSSQPSSSITNEAKDFESASTLKNITIDPTRGTLLKMIENNPTIIDRINQGGVVGYIILVLGGLGLLFAIYKILTLNLTSMKIKKQIKKLPEAKNTNALGRVAKVFNENINDSINDLEIKVGEAIIKETNKIKKGQSFVKLLAAVTPLLGLLGTVTGMIATFQAITLFGTGDPKLMAGGISTALITTVLGLVTAIPLLFAYTYIASKSEELVSILEEQSIGLLAKNIK